jgi:hypothetical protein
VSAMSFELAYVNGRRTRDRVRRSVSDSPDARPIGRSTSSNAQQVNHRTSKYDHEQRKLGHIEQGASQSSPQVSHGQINASKR